MKRIWPFISIAVGLLIMLFGFIYYVAFAGLRYEDPRPEVSAPVATQAHISFVISWIGAAFFLFGLLTSFINLILYAKLSDGYGRPQKLKITVIAVTLAFMATFACIVSVMSCGFFVFSPLAVVSVWLMNTPMWIGEHFTGPSTNTGWGTIIIPLFIQFFGSSTFVMGNQP